MISTKELRDKVATLGSNYLTDEEWIEVIDRLEAAEQERDWQAKCCEDAMNECAALRADKATLQQMTYSLKDRLEAAEKERVLDEQRIADLMADLNRVGHENDNLRTKIEHMEQQEPVWFIDERGEPKRYHKSKADYCKYGGLDLLYALPGAKGVPKC